MILETVTTKCLASVELMQAYCLYYMYYIVLYMYYVCILIQILPIIY